MKMTAASRVSGLALSARQTSNPSMAGIMMSSSTRSGVARCAISRAVAPSRATRIRWPVPYKVRTTTCRLVALSSTTRIVDGGTAAIVSTLLTLAPRACAFERQRQVAHAIEIEVRRKTRETLAERGLRVRTAGKHRGNSLEIGHRANRDGLPEPRREPGVTHRIAKADVARRA